MDSDLPAPIKTDDEDGPAILPSISADKNLYHTNSVIADELISKKDANSGANVQQNNLNELKKVYVTDPERMGDKEPFVMYTVLSASPEGEVWKVKRRFQDFADLHSTLSEQLPASVILPPLPSKANFDLKDKFNPVFIERRRKSLERFLRRLLDHPNLENNETMRAFLSEQNIRLANTSTSSLSTASHAAASGFNSIVDHFGDILVGVGIFSRPNTIEERFEKMKERCKKLEAHYSKLDSLFGNLYKAHRTMEEAMRMASQDFIQAQANFSQLRAMLDSEDTMQLDVMMTKMAVIYEDQANTINSYAVALKADVVTPIHEFTKYSNAAKECLKLRDEKQVNSEELSHYLVRSKQQLSELRGLSSESSQDPGRHRESILGPIKSSAKAMSSYVSDHIDRMKGVDTVSAKQQRLAQLEKRISDLETAVKVAKQSSEEIDLEIDKEVEHVEEVIKREMDDEVLPKLSSIQQTFMTKSSHLWSLDN